jgi:hypothetical protein
MRMMAYRPVDSQRPRNKQRNNGHCFFYVLRSDAVSLDWLSWVSANRLITPGCDSGKWQIRPHIRESAPHQQTCNCLTVIKIWSYAPDGCFIPRETGRQTVGRNIILTLTLVSAVVLVSGVEQVGWWVCQSDDCCGSVLVSYCCSKLVGEERGEFGNPE